MGLSSYIAEQKADPNSVLSKKYGLRPPRLSFIAKGSLLEGNHTEEEKSINAQSVPEIASRKSSLPENAEEKAAVSEFLVEKRNSGT